MKNKFVWAVLLLWMIAILSTFFVVKDAALFARLGPVYFVCMLGSIVTVRKSQAARR